MSTRFRIVLSVKRDGSERGTSFHIMGAEARAILESLSAAARDRYVPPTHLALIETALGDRDQAFAHLEAAVEVRDARLALLKIDPKWNDLRSDPRFAALLHRMRF